MQNGRSDYPTGLGEPCGESKCKMDKTNTCGLGHLVRYRASIAKWLHVMLALLFGAESCQTVTTSPLIINQRLPPAGGVGYNPPGDWWGGRVEASVVMFTP